MAEVDPLYEVLYQFGLYEDEIAMCLLLRERGALCAAVVARELELPRPHVYDVLSFLAERGVLTTSLCGETRIFRPASYRGLLTQHEKQKRVRLQFPKLDAGE